MSPWLQRQPVPRLRLSPRCFVVGWPPFGGRRAPETKEKNALLHEMTEADVMADGHWMQRSPVPRLHLRPRVWLDNFPPFGTMRFDNLKERTGMTPTWTDVALSTAPWTEV